MVTFKLTFFIVMIYSRTNQRKPTALPLLKGGRCVKPTEISLNGGTCLNIYRGALREIKYTGRASFVNVGAQKRVPSR